MMPGRTILLSAAAIFAASAAPPPAPDKSHGPPRRIVSVDLCADQIVLDLADRGQIAGLSRYAPDPELSAAAAKARGLTILHDTGESMLVANPDMIVAIPQLRAGMLDALDRTRLRMVEAPGADRYADIVTELRQVGAAVGHPERAKALIRAMDARLAALPRNAGQGRVAAYYQRRGYMTGTGTLIDDMMRRLGLVNLAGKLGKPVLSQLTLEELVAAKPDYLIMESATAAVTDQGTEMLHHPALRDIPRLWVPQAWTVCGSPNYVLAAESLVRQMKRLRHSNP